MTALPIIETKPVMYLLIPTNVVSITDGQIFLSKIYLTLVLNQLLM